MAQLFVDRDEELRFLEERFNSTGSELIYGRRRVGKTELVARFVKGSLLHVFWLTGDLKGPCFSSFGQR